ncbi:hypothetical protein PMAYCL1PPCAC_01778, partial [Pristionchus mayeri]
TNSDSSSDYLKNVLIKSVSDNSQFTLADLAKPKSSSGYFLDETKLLTAPITIVDTNAEPATGFLIRPPYTIYMIRSDLPVAPVVSAELVNGQVDSSLAKIKSDSCTILSAEQSILISNIDSNMNQVLVMVAGWDSVGTENKVLTVTKDKVGSSVVISGPIATLYATGTNGGGANYSFKLKRDIPFTGSLSPGASISFFSNGWLSENESYNVDYVTDYIRGRSYDFGRETQISFSTTIGGFNPNKGDSIKFTCGKANGTSTIYDCGALNGRTQDDLCKSISLNAMSGGTTWNGPQFRVMIESGE